MKKIVSFSAVSGALLPLIAFGAVDATYIIGKVNQLLSIIIPVLITIGVIYFIWGVIQYTMSQDDEAKKGARDKIIQGIIGLFVIVSFWGIVGVISNTFGVGSTSFSTNNRIPCIPSQFVVCP